MRKRITGTLFLIIMICSHLSAHSGKPKYHVIIDTDGALDDMRALSMFLSGNDIRVLAINCSQGAFSPESVFTKVSTLLASFHHEGIPVGVSKETDAELPADASSGSEILWGNPANPDALYFTGKSTEILNQAIKDYPEKVTLVALGSLKTYAEWIKDHPGYVDKIDRIIWYNSHNITEGYNYQLSPESYESIRQSGIRLDVVMGYSDAFPVDRDYLKVIRNTGSIYAGQIAEVHSGSPVTEALDQGDLYLREDLVPLYLTVPILFENETAPGLRSISLNRLIPASYINELIGKLLMSATTTNNRVFNSFPVEAKLYKPEYADIMHQTIEKFGLIEWKAIALTNEIHGHTGIYSIIGAKMGIRAMDYFNVGINNLEVTTFAGNDPPLSCFNDGVQISTGATIGQGLITISDSTSAIPSAIFEFNGRKVRIAAKPEIAEQMQREIRHGVETYGALTDPYWLYIEDLAIKYWADFDRNEIFVIERKR